MIIHAIFREFVFRVSHHARFFGILANLLQNTLDREYHHDESEAEPAGNTFLLELVIVVEDNLLQNIDVVSTWILA